MTDGRGRFLLGWAWLVSLPVLLMPVGDPDVWWHLSAARDAVRSGALPSAETLSFTLTQTAWVNFEWLGQLIFYGVYFLGGLAGLWLLKALLLAAAAGGVHSLLGRIGIGAHYRATATALWLAAALPRADARIELFSIVAFTWLVCSLELRRRGEIRFTSPRLTVVLAAAATALWCNVHAGFVYGLAVLAVYAADASLERSDNTLWWAVGGALAGTLINPYGIGLHQMLWRHSVEAAGLQSLILEWAPLNPARPGHWPTWIFLAASAGGLVAAWRVNRRVPPLFTVLLGLFGMAALRHARVGIFFATLAVAFLPVLAPRLPALTKRNFRAAALFLALLGAYGMWMGASSGVLRVVSHSTFWPVGATAYLLRSPQLLDLRLYNAWGWGGYLGFHFEGRKPIFQDGRYIFHPLLLEAKEAIASPGAWNRFLDKYGVESALMENAPLKIATTREYPDGSRRSFMRPYYLSFMPRGKWALVYWDEKALLFVRRELLTLRGMEGREYKVVRPGDGEALGDALSRGEIDTALLERERVRHARETDL